MQMSRSVTTPTTRSPATTGRMPQSASHIRIAAEARLSPGSQALTSRVIRSCTWTFIAALLSGSGYLISIFFASDFRSRGYGIFTSSTPSANLASIFAGSGSKLSAMRRKNSPCWRSER